ncbi:MAG: gamma-glutamylcyclotransferase [Cellulosilyticaceae bacterium]
MEKIFVYGSLMKSFRNHDKVLKHRATETGKGKIKGALYHLPEGYPAVTTGDMAVHGEVYTLSKNKLIKGIDLLEGYLGEGKDNLYERRRQLVTLEDGKVVECWSYMYVNEGYAKRKGKLVKDGNWAKFMASKY